jgi:C1A family cysteine protease
MFSGKRDRPCFTWVRAFGAAAAVLMVLGSLVVLSAAVVTAAEQIKVAPANPQFLKFMAERQAAALTGAPVVKKTRSGHSLGRIPSRIDFSYLRHPARSQKTAVTSYPSSFDLRNVSGVNHVTPVRDQSDCGSCWAFGVLGSLESKLMPGSPSDFSEQALIDTHGYNLGPCDGGTDEMAMAVMSRQGVVSEKQYTYHYLDALSKSPPASQYSWPGAHVQDVTLIAAGLDSNGNPITSNIKSALLTQLTAVAVSFYYDDGWYDGVEDYYDPDTDVANHEVAVVGWNDDYQASNFLNTPPGNGAWLVKNSWGTSWGLNGYFYLSYYDASVSTAAYVYNNAESVTNYDWTYQYDSLGWTDSVGAGSNTAWMANIFRAGPQASNIHAVSFYVANGGTPYTVKIYDQVNWSLMNPVKGILKATFSGAISSPGYHTVRFASPVKVTPGYNFSVVVKLTDETGYQYPIAIEDQIMLFTDRSYSISNQSFISGDGNNWTDMYSANSEFLGKACLKAFGSME